MIEAVPTSPDPSISEVREFILDGDEVRFILESTYWQSMEDIAEREGMTLAELVNSIRARAARAYERELKTHDLVSTIHIFVVSYFRQAATRSGADLIEEALMDMVGEPPSKSRQ